MAGRPKGRPAGLLETEVERLLDIANRSSLVIFVFCVVNWPIVKGFEVGFWKPEMPRPTAWREAAEAGGGMLADDERRPDPPRLMG